MPKYRMTVLSDSEVEIQAAEALLRAFCQLEILIENIGPGRIYHKYLKAEAPKGALAVDHPGVIGYERCFKCGTLSCVIRGKSERLFWARGKWVPRFPCTGKFPSKA